MDSIHKQLIEEGFGKEVNYLTDEEFDEAMSYLTDEELAAIEMILNRGAKRMEETKSKTKGGSKWRNKKSKRNT